MHHQKQLDLGQVGCVGAQSPSPIPAGKKHSICASISPSRPHSPAFERVTLYGLTIVAKRRVVYGPIDPQVAREIFIRNALVAGDLETRSPFQASGIRLGSPAVTTRGMKEPEMAAIADMISEVLMDINNLDTIGKVRQRVRELTAKFPLPY